MVHDFSCAGEENGSHAGGLEKRETGITPFPRGRESMRKRWKEVERNMENGSVDDGVGCAH